MGPIAVTGFLHTSGRVPLGIGIAGMGPAGTYHVERIGLRDDCQIVAAFDDCPAALHKAAGLVPRPAGSFHELLANPAVELVLVATPPGSHAPLVLESLAAGKHVLVETPLCLSTLDADAILAAAGRAGRSVIVAHTRRWDSDFRQAHEAVRRGLIGRLETIKHVDWQFGCRPRRGAPPESPLGPHDWRDSQSTGGGVLWEAGIHVFDQLLLLAGEPALGVFVEPCFAASAAGLADSFLALVQFASGLRAHVEVNRAALVSLQTGWMAVGEAGAYSAGVHYSLASDGEVIDVPAPAVTFRPDEFYARVVGHLRDGEPNPVPAAQARQTVALIEAACRSARSGQVAAVASG